MIVFAYAALLASTAWIVLGLYALWHATRAKPDARSRATASEPVSVLKPLCGADPDLADNLASFFEQDHPNLQLIFGVEDACDPAIAVVRQLQCRYPHVASRLVVHPGRRGRNPKVSNLRGMLPYAEYDVLLVSDSNIRAPRHYVSEMVERLGSAPSVGLVTNVFAGAGEDTFAAALENVQLNGFCASGTTLPTLLGDSLVVGKSMLFRKSAFERIGGFERVANVLAEDFVMGKMFQHAGLDVVIAPTVVANRTSNMSVAAYFRRHLRWSMLRWRLRPVAYALEPVTSPLALLPLAVALYGALGAVWMLGLLWLRDVGGWIVLRGPRRAWLPALLCLAREVTMLAIWTCAPLKRHVTWRGHKVRLGAGTLLYEPALSFTEQVV